MSLWIDQKYLSLLSARLDRYTRKSDKLYNFRCPFCGDSQKSKWKARGFVYVKKGGMFYKCHNCGHGTNMKGLIESVDPGLVKQYNFERFVEPIQQKRTDIWKMDQPKFKKKPEKSVTDLQFKTIAGPALEYAKARMLPESLIETLYWVEDSQSLELLDPKYEGRILGNEPRLVIPFYNVNGKLFALQARAIGNSKFRYITIKLDEDHPLVYGLERVDFSKRCYVLEGPFDSMFIPNAIAVAGADLDRVASKVKDCCVVFDNQPRNPQLVDKIESMLRGGFEVVLWPENIKEKDVNEMVCSGMTIPKIVDVINANTFKDTAGLLALSQWRKV
jgi:transcription elongation factor Elf1